MESDGINPIKVMNKLPSFLNYRPFFDFFPYGMNLNRGRIMKYQDLTSILILDQPFMPDVSPTHYAPAIAVIVCTYFDTASIR